MRIAVVVGVRPHFVKLAALLPAISKDHDVTIIHTGQHYSHELSTAFFQEFQLPPPDIELDVGSGAQVVQVGHTMTAVGRALVTAPVDMVIVFGDANTSLGGALAAAKVGLPLVHIEGGVRNHDRRLPEEVNRVLIDAASERYFCPTARCAQNLIDEGRPPSMIEFTGDLLLDATMKWLPSAEVRSSLLAELTGRLVAGPYALLTFHRASIVSNEEELRALARAVSDLDLRVVCPLHPRAADALDQFNLRALFGDSCQFVPPQPYAAILSLIANASLVLTDSNGIQRESYFLRVPAVVLRDNTEYPETLMHGTGALVAPREFFDLSASVNKVLNSVDADAFDLSLFGTPGTAERIAAALEFPEMTPHE